MQKVYYVQNKRTREVLNAKGGWSDKITSYRLAEFASEADAQAAFPAGVDCEIVVRNKKEADK